MANTPYSACPCGSGKQFKWCCQPYYSFVEKATAQHERGQHVAAEQTLAQLVAKFPNVPQAWGFQAQLFTVHEKTDAAEAALQKAFDLDPNFAFGYWLRGLMRLAEGESLGALLLFRKCAELLNADAVDLQVELHIRIAELELGFLRPVAARVALERVRRLAPNVQEVQQGFNNFFGPNSRLPAAAMRNYSLRAIADDKIATSRLADGLNVCEGAAQANPSDPAAAFNLGLVRAWLGDNQRAIDDLYRSIEHDSDEAKAEESGALAEVLRLGRGMEESADYLEHSAYIQIRDGQLVGKVINEWAQSGRLVFVDVDEKGGNFSSLLLEEVTMLGAGIGTPVARLQSYLAVQGGIVHIWHAHRTMLDRTIDELRTRAGAAFSEPHFDTQTAQFSDVVIDVMLLPARQDVDPEQINQKMREQAREYFEETWAHQPLKSLAGASPIDAVNQPAMRKRLPGVIRFLQQCVEGMLPRGETAPKPIYDFDRLRRKLGLATAPAAEGAAIEFDTLSASALGELNPDKLNDDQIAQAFRAAIRLDAPELAAAFAMQATARSTIPERYPYFNHLARLARDAGNHAESLRWLGEGEQADVATNEGRKHEEYALARGQALARSGDVDGAYGVFKETISRSPDSIALYSQATESMLGRKQGTRALEFAESGLKLARLQNNRDAEQQFLELAAAAKKQIQ